MLTWTRAERKMICGYCRAELARGDPILMIEFVQVRRALIRCPNCTDEPMPPLPPLKTEPKTAGDFDAVRPQPREWLPYREEM